MAVTRSALRKIETVGKLYVRAVQRGWLEDSPGMRLQFIAACAVCSEAKRQHGHKTHPDEDVGRLFTWFVKNRKWEDSGQISCEALDLASATKPKIDPYLNQLLHAATSDQFPSARTVDPSKNPSGSRR